MALADQVILRTTRALQPAAASLTPGAIVCISDEGNILERTTGAVWEAFSPGAGSGDVTASGTLTASALMLGAGTTIISAAASLGTTTTVLHGNAAGAPTFGAVVEADITLADNTTNNAATTKHGLLKKLSNVATEYMDGTGAWSTPAGGGVVFLEGQTASSSASLDFAAWYSASYAVYLIEIAGLVAATDNVSLLMRMSTDGGATYDAGANYGYAANIVATSGFSSVISGAGQTAITFGTAIDNAVTNGWSGSYRLFSPGSTALHKIVSGQGWGLANDGNAYTFNGGGVYTITTAVNAVRFLFSAGNIASGTIRIYGIANS